MPAKVTIKPVTGSPYELLIDNGGRVILPPELGPVEIAQLTDLLRALQTEIAFMKVHGWRTVELELE